MRKKCLNERGFSELLILLAVGVAFFVVIFISNFNPTSFTLIRGSEGNTLLQTPTPTPMETPRADLLLPDMQLAPPTTLYIRQQAGRKTMRFNTTFSNIGNGPLELTGHKDDEREVVIATQHIRKIDGGSESVVIGEFVYHPTHKHWHVDRYAQFQVYSYDAEGNPQNLMASTDKFSFCIWDEHTYDLSLPGAPQTRQYPRCINDIQGNSVGWGDTYTARTDGQEIDITNIPDGKYLIKSIVNADRTLREINYDNNEAILYIEITGNSLRLLEEP
jgi:hypothetical protein